MTTAEEIRAYFDRSGRLPSPSKAEVDTLAGMVEALVEEGAIRDRSMGSPLFYDLRGHRVYVNAHLGPRVGITCSVDRNAVSRNYGVGPVEVAAFREMLRGLV